MTKEQAEVISLEGSSLTLKYKNLIETTFYVVAEASASFKKTYKEVKLEISELEVPSFVSGGGGPGG